MKILITGGHLTPALALIEVLKERGHNLVYIGRKSSFAHEDTPSVESEVVPKMGVKYYDFVPVKLQRDYALANLLTLPKFPYTVIQAAKILRKEKPAVVVSFGGYVAVPFAVASYLKKTPLITHEQTMVAGLSNRMIGKLARKVAVSWPDSARFFPKNKTVYTGNLIRRELLKVKKEDSKEKTIYVTGGNQGSHVINQVIESGLNTLLAKYKIFHQVGNSNIYNDYDRLHRLRDTLVPELGQKYIVSKWFETNELTKIYSQAHLIVGRSGANTITELAVLSKPAILIPIPWSSFNEQTLNAQLLEKTGSVIVIPQTDLSFPVLSGALETIFKNYADFARKAEANHELVPLDAAEKLADLIESLV